MYTNWLSPEASGARGITSDSGYLCVLVLRGGNSRELIEPRDKSSCPILPCVIPWSADYTALWAKYLSSIPSLKVACEEHQHLTLKSGGWNSTHNQLRPRDVQACPVCLSFFSKQIHKAKSPKNMTGSPPLKARKAPIFFEHQRGNKSLDYRLVSVQTSLRQGFPEERVRQCV